MSALDQLFGEYVEYTPKARKVTPTVIELIWKRYGKENAITGKQIKAAILQKHNLKIEGSEIRQIISLIRHECVAPNLIACGNGYYRSDDIKELETYVQSIAERANNISHVGEVVSEYIQKLKRA